MDLHYDVFISYSRRDIAEADAVCAVLSKAGITYFIDREGISGGANFPEVLAQMIDACSVFLLIGGENSYKSKFTRAEILYAFNHKKSGCIVPWLIDSSPMPADLEFLLGSVNWLYRSSSSMDDLLSAVQQALTNPSSGIASPKTGSRIMTWIAVVVLAILLSAGLYFGIKSLVVKNSISADYILYERLKKQADSLQRQAAIWKNSPMSIETTPDQIAALKEARFVFERADSIRKRYAGTEDQYRFQALNKELQVVNTRLDSMHFALYNAAKESCQIYKYLNDNTKEAQYIVSCIDNALSIKENPDLEVLREEFLKK